MTVEVTNLCIIYVAELGFKIGIPVSAVRCITDCTMKPSKKINITHSSYAIKCI